MTFYLGDETVCVCVKWYAILDTQHLLLPGKNLDHNQTIRTPFQRSIAHKVLYRKDCFQSNIGFISCFYIDVDCLPSVEKTYILSLHCNGSECLYSLSKRGDYSKLSRTNRRVIVQYLVILGWLPPSYPNPIFMNPFSRISIFSGFSFARFRWSTTSNKFRSQRS